MYRNRQLNQFDFCNVLANFRFRYQLAKDILSINLFYILNSDAVYITLAHGH